MTPGQSMAPAVKHQNKTSLQAASFHDPGFLVKKRLPCRHQSTYTAHIHHATIYPAFTPLANTTTLTPLTYTTPKSVAMPLTNALCFFQKPGNDGTEGCLASVLRLRWNHGISSQSLATPASCSPAQCKGSGT